MLMYMLTNTEKLTTLSCYFNYLLIISELFELYNFRI